MRWIIDDGGRLVDLITGNTIEIVNHGKGMRKPYSILWGSGSGSVTRFLKSGMTEDEAELWFRRITGTIGGGFIDDLRGVSGG